jgi:2-C-methyl-D-erythritol 4-phosphate cytidylyltransferase
MRVAGVVLATGSAAAALSPLSLIGGVPMLAWAVSALRAGGATDQLVVVVDPAGAAEAEIRQALDRSVPGHDALVVAGGPGRHAALHRALSIVESRIETVVLHDACRPLAAADLVTRVLAVVRAGAVAAVPAVEVTETVKELDPAGRVAATVPRESLRRLQTPQAVRRSVLAAAHAGCRIAYPATDDILALTPGGTAPAIVAGDDAAFPVIDLADLALAEAVIGGSRAGVRRREGRRDR